MCNDYSLFDLSRWGGEEAGEADDSHQVNDRSEHPYWDHGSAADRNPTGAAAPPEASLQVLQSLLLEMDSIYVLYGGICKKFSQ